MFKVSVREEREGQQVANVSLEVEGCLAGAWVSELEKCWQIERARFGKHMYVRLTGVTFIDEAGKQLLAEMFQEGAKLEGNGCMVRAILAKIMGQRIGT
jgi:anti-anti-sigma regulatory factor